MNLGEHVKALAMLGFKKDGGGAAGGSLLVSQSGISSGIAPEGIIGANGALAIVGSLGNGNPAVTTYTEGLWLFFPAESLYAGSAAGSYWTVMSSASAGVVYDNRYLSGALTPPETLTPIVGPGPGAYTPPLFEVTLVSIVIPSCAMGANGTLFVVDNRVMSNSGSTKTSRARFAGNQIGQFSGSYAPGPMLGTRVWNMNRTDKQQCNSIATTGYQPFSNFAGQCAPSYLAVDTTQDQILTLTGQLALASDLLVCCSHTIEIING